MDKQSAIDMILAAKEQRTQPDRAILRFQGEMDHANLPAFNQVFQEVFQSGVHRVVVDLSQVESLLSSHLGLLWSHCLTARQSGGDLRIFGLKGAVAKAFAMVGFDKMMKIFTDETAADTSFVD